MGLLFCCTALKIAAQKMEIEIKWFLNNKLFSSFSKKDFGEINYPFNKDFFLIINLQIGRNRPGNSDINSYKN